MKPLQKSGASHSGVIEWLAQRLSAVYLAGFTVFVLARFMLAPITEAAAWREWMTDSLVRAGWALFYISILAHGWIGMRSVFLDYIKPFWLRLVLTLGLGIGMTVVALWALEILYLRGGA